MADPVCVDSAYFIVYDLSNVLKINSVVHICFNARIN